MASAGELAYNGGLGAEPPAGHRGRAPGQGAENLLASGCATEAANLRHSVRTLTGPTPPTKNSSALYQSQERPLAKVGWTGLKLS